MSKRNENILAYRANDFVEARVLAAHLDEAGVHARVVGDFLDGAYGGIRTGSMLGNEVWIAADEMAIAEPLLAAWQAEYHGKPMEPAPLTVRFSTKSALVIMTGAAIIAAVLSTVYRWFGLSATLNVTQLVFVAAMCYAFFWDLRRQA